MVTREEVEWLYRCILGRPPESDAVVDWAIANCSDFAAARRHFIAAGEFQEQLGRLYMPRASVQGSNPARFEAVLHKLKVVRWAPSGEAERSLIPFGGLEPILRVVAPRLRAQIAVVHGGIDDLRLTIDMLVVGGVRPCVVVMCKSDDALDLATALPANVTLPPWLTIVERNGTIEALMNEIRATDIQPELVVLSSATLTETDVFAAYQALYFSGLVICDFKSGSKCESAVKACAEHLHLDAVRFDRFYLLQKTAWYTPVSYKPARIADYIRRDSEPSLAVATIVKNEASNIERMLASIVPVASFVALIDTGSTDDTVERATRLLTGSGVPFVTQTIPFVNFSQARNAALEGVPATLDWILMLDADEHFVPEDYTRLRDLLVADVDAWMLPRYNFYDAHKIEDPSPYPDRQRRLFRNRPERPIRFAGQVHETPSNVDRWGVAPANLAYLGGDVGGPHIHHTGQVALSKERWHEKNSFYGKLMQQAASEK